MSNDNAPLVSVIIPVFNHEKYLQFCLNSIIKQTYDNLELIVLNDGSTDNSHQKITEIIPKCEERFIKTQYINKENEGITKTLNIGIEKAGGQYIFLLASDDCLAHDNAINLMVHELEQADNIYAFCCGNAEIIDQNNHRIYWDSKRNACGQNTPQTWGTFIAFFLRRRENFNYEQDFGTYASLIKGNYIPVGWLLKKSALLDIGLFNEGVLLEDWDLWLRLSKKYKFKYINKVLSSYRWHTLNTSKTRTPDLLLCALKLIINEKHYCQQNNLFYEWINKFIRTLIHALLHNPWKIIKIMGMVFVAIVSQKS